MSQMSASVGMVDDDEVLLRHVEELEASFGVNSETDNLVEKSKDQEKSGEPVDGGYGVNLTSENLLLQNCNEQDKENSYGEDIAVDNGKNKEANIEAACGEMEVDSEKKQGR